LVEIATAVKNRLVAVNPKAPLQERLGWQPWLDGSVVTSHPFDPQAPALAADVPMLIGSTLHEFGSLALAADPRTLTEEWLAAEIAKTYGDAAPGSASQKSGFGGTPKPATPRPPVTSFGSSIISW
jgi:para-nitrobenzyl esterase